MPEENETIEEIEEVIEGEEIQEKLKKMREDLKACRKEKDEYLAGWQRAKADFINARKDEDKAKESFIKFAEAGLLNDFLAVADSLEMAEKHAKNDGAREIFSQFKEILKKHGVIPIETSGKKFNPMEHEAIEKIETGEEGKDGEIIEELQKGWYLHDRVLRPAKVKVGNYKK